MTHPEHKKSKQFVPPSEEFIQLFTQAQRQLYLFILAQIGKTQAAEEVLQETNLVIWAKSAQFESGTNFLAWARQIAVYEVLKWRQKRGREKLTFSSEFTNHLIEEYDDLTSGDEIERRQIALEKCMEKLNQQDRELIEKRYQPGATGKQVAKALGRPANSVYQSLGRIRQALLECVERTLSLES